MFVYMYFIDRLVSGHLEYFYVEFCGMHSRSVYFISEDIKSAEMMIVISMNCTQYAVHGYFLQVDAYHTEWDITGIFHG